MPVAVALDKQECLDAFDRGKQLIAPLTKDRLTKLPAFENSDIGDLCGDVKFSEGGVHGLTTKTPKLNFSPLESSEHVTGLQYLSVLGLVLCCILALAATVLCIELVITICRRLSHAKAVQREPLKAPEELPAPKKANRSGSGGLAAHGQSPLPSVQKK
ncbi:hypothetical protein M3Y99_01654200 [Aphelenchoides fujianensis]|nr:hypothetical protein M3Y99_01654200 [Aphelenchoides fujianensis]